MAGPPHCCLFVSACLSFFCVVCVCVSNSLSLILSFCLYVSASLSLILLFCLYVSASLSLNFVILYVCLCRSVCHYIVMLLYFCQPVCHIRYHLDCPCLLNPVCLPACPPSMPFCSSVPPNMLSRVRRVFAKDFPPLPVPKRFLTALLSQLSGLCWGKC